MQFLLAHIGRGQRNSTITKRGSKPYYRLGWSAIAVICGGLISWSALAPIHGAVISEGVIQVESNRKAIQHLESGIVKRIFVEEGDFVKEGEVLVHLDTTLVEATRARLESQLLLYVGKEARLIAERSDLEYINFDALSALPFGASGKADIIAKQTSLFVSRRARQKGEKDAFRAQIEQSEAHISGLQAQIAALARQLKLVEQETESYRKLYERGYATLPRLLSLKRAIENFRGQIGQNEASIAEARKSIRETEVRLSQTDNIFIEEVAGELEETRVLLSELREQHTRALIQLRRSDVVAPQAGHVLSLSVFSEGAIVTAGTSLMYIVPTNDPLVIIAFVRTQDIDQVHEGADCRIRFTAFSQRTTPEFMGHVEDISDDRIVDEHSGDAAYRVEISIPPSVALKNFSLKPGMPAEVFIQTETRTAISYLLKPLSDAIRRSFH